MDHFFLLKDAIPIRSGMDRVPYVCMEKYDGGPFLTYSLRKGRPWMVPERTEGYQFPCSVYGNWHSTPVRSWILSAKLGGVLEYSVKYWVVHIERGDHHFPICDVSIDCVNIDSLFIHPQFPTSNLFNI